MTEDEQSALEWMLQNYGETILQLVKVGATGTVHPTGGEEQEIEVIAAWTRPDTDA